jgi:hypothetical protein
MFFNEKRLHPALDLLLARRSFREEDRRSRQYVA